MNDLEERVREILKENKEKVTLKNEALHFIGKCSAIKEQLKRKPDFAIIIKVNGFELGICDNQKFMELLNNEILQAELCIEGKENKYE